MVRISLQLTTFYFIFASYIYTAGEEIFLHCVQILPVVLTFLISVGAANDRDHLIQATLAFTIIKALIEFLIK